MTELNALVEDAHLNAVLAWIIIGVLLLAAVVSAFVGKPVWAVLPVATVVLALIPTVAFRDTSTMVPWEVLVLSVPPTITHFVTLPDILTDIATFVAVVAVALLVAVEFHIFSPVEMPPVFAVVFVVLLTMATAGLWTIIQYASDSFLHTTLITSQTSTMWDLVIATAVSVLAGPIFGVYFRAQATDGGREFLPEGH